MSSYILHGSLSWILANLAFSKKNLFLRDNFMNRIWRISKRQLIFMALAAGMSWISIPKDIMPIFFIEYALLFYVLRIVSYWLLYRFLKFKRSKQINSIQTAIVGCSRTSTLLQNIIVSNPNLGYSFLGFICSNEACSNISLGHPDDLEELIDKHNIQTLFYAISFFNGDNADKHGKEVLKICNHKGVRLKFVPTNQRWFKSRTNMESIGDLVIINPQEIPLDNVVFRVQKRLFDILFSGMIILLIFSWLFPIIALIIKLDSKGPVFFIQKRTGVNNKTFCCLKFRSMKVNGNANKQQARANDSRITKVGRFLRKSNIDELPQFINVLLGQMSVVGPRPHMLLHTDEYSALIDHYLIRHYVKPGITGWAQVKGYRGETKQLSAMENRVNADMKYIENWTFLWDFKIIWLTVFGRNAWKNAF
jgi:Undecaprenyl-phosphate glucose phosphotransferase